MIRRLFRLLLILATVGAAILLADRPASDVYAPAACRAIDGDTIACGEEHIRLAGIDAPELHGQCPAETRRAERATLHAMIALGTGRIEVRRERAKDKFGRTLAHVAIDERDLGRSLVEAGLARAYDGGSRAGWC